jgi:hypothetical protein
MQLSECHGDATPVGFGLGRSALHVGHYHQTVGEVPTVCGRDRLWHRHPFSVQVLQQVGLPREINVAALAETTDREVPVDTHAPHPVDASSASERFAANDVVTPLLECHPSHRPHLRRRRVALEWTYHLDAVNIAHGPSPVDPFLGTPTRHLSELAHLRQTRRWTTVAAHTEGPDTHALICR